jgi:hypothetical protein
LLDVRVIKIRMDFILTGEFGGDFQEIESKSAGDKEKLLLVRQLELISMLPSPASDRPVPTEAKPLMDLIAASPKPNPQDETSMLLPWESALYLDVKKKILQPAAPPDPIKVLDGGIARAGDLKGARAAVEQAGKQIEESPNAPEYAAWKKELETRKSILAEMETSRKRDKSLEIAAGLGDKNAKDKWTRFVKSVRLEPDNPITQPSDTDIDKFLAEALAEIEKGDTAKAGAKLAEAEDAVKNHPPQDRDLASRKIAFWKNVNVLADATLSAADVPRLLDVVAKLKEVGWDRTTIEVDGVPQAPLVCKLLKNLAKFANAALVDDALNLVGKAGESYSRVEIHPCLVELFRKRVQLFVGQDIDPQRAREQFERLDHIWQSIKGDGKPEAFADWEAWTIEYRIALPANNKAAYEQALAKAPWLPSKASLYVSYVRCLGVHEKYEKTPGLAWGLSPQEWDAYLGDLHRVLASGSRDAGILSEERLQKARSWASAAIVAYFDKEVLARSDIHVKLPDSTAKLVCEIVRRIEPDVSALPSDLKIPFAVAATCLSAPDLGPAEEVLKHLDTEGNRATYRIKIKKAAPLLCAYLRCRLGSNPAADPSADRANSVFVYCKWLLDAYLQTREEELADHDGARLSGGEAETLAKEVIDPALGLADAIAAKGSPSTEQKERLATFYEAVFDFSQRYPGIQLPEYAKVHSQWRATILDSAIRLAEELETQQP